MPVITLPDGSTRSFDGAVTGTTVAAAIGPGLAKAALAMELDGKLVDLATPVEVDSSLRFVTRKDPEALELIRSARFHLDRTGGYEPVYVDRHMDALAAALSGGGELPPRPGYR